MYKFSESVSIALHGLVLLEKSDERLNVKEIALKISSFTNTVAKVFQILAKHELVESVRGSKGGFLITKKGMDSSFFDVIEIIDGISNSGNCPVNKVVCPFEKCFLNKEFFRINKELKDYFKKMKIKQV
ncbi:MAG: Rrf2 family transcriptional regulator [Spirochaetota bacterium]